MVVFVTSFKAKDIYTTQSWERDKDEGSQSLKLRMYFFYLYSAHEENSYNDISLPLQHHRLRARILSECT